MSARENHLARLRELQRRYSACEESNNEDARELWKRTKDFGIKP